MRIEVGLFKNSRRTFLHAQHNLRFRFLKNLLLHSMQVARVLCSLNFMDSLVINFQRKSLPVVNWLTSLSNYPRADSLASVVFQHYLYPIKQLQWHPRTYDIVTMLHSVWPKTVIYRFFIKDHHGLQRDGQYEYETAWSFRFEKLRFEQNRRSPFCLVPHPVVRPK